MIFEYKGRLYPSLIKNGGGSRWIAAIAAEFCQGKGYDVGCGDWPLTGAIPIDLKHGHEAMELPHGKVDYVFSSHCLEHLINPIAALEHWKSRLRPGGVLFLYLPHPDMEYWLPQNCRKHLHSWAPFEIASILSDIGFGDVIRSERDMAYGFSVVGFNRPSEFNLLRFQ